MLNYVFTNYILKSKLFLGIPTIIFEGFDTYEYEDCFAMHHFYVSTAVATAGCAKAKNSDKLKPILLSEIDKVNYCSKILEIQSLVWTIIYSAVETIMIKYIIYFW